MGKHAKGRSRQDFFPLNAAEQKILEAAAAGEVAKIGETRPDAKGDANTVRATFLRFLALGGDDEVPVHERGLWVQGAWITGGLDLSGAEIAGALTLVKCRFDQILMLFDARIRGLFSLAGSFVPGLYADRLNCLAGVSLNEEFTSNGQIRLLGATIGGDLVCTKGIFSNPNGRAINAEKIKVDGRVFMGGDLKAWGEIRLAGATIGGDLSFRRGRFKRLGGAAIECESITVSGMLSFDNVSVTGGATIDLAYAHVARLVDDLASWPENIILDGFVYDSFAGDAPTTAKARLGNVSV